MSFLVVCGLPITALLGYLIVPVLGWRPMFVLAGVGALIVWWLRKNLPESPRWLEAKGRGAEAEALLQAIEKESGAARPPKQSQCRKSPSRHWRSRRCSIA